MDYSNVTAGFFIVGGNYCPRCMYREVKYRYVKLPHTGHALMCTIIPHFGKLCQKFR